MYSKFMYNYIKKEYNIICSFVGKCCQVSKCFFFFVSVWFLFSCLDIKKFYYLVALCTFCLLYSNMGINKKGNKMKKQLTKKELISKIESLEKIYKINEDLKMYEACIINNELITYYSNELKELNNK